MGRPHRLDLAGGVYHVMNRGGAHRTIFHSANDGATFLRVVGQAAERHAMKVLAYCLMPNHYHLLVACPKAGLSSFMHRIGSLYARYHNDRLQRDGPIFRGRFHSLTIDSDEYLACAGRYVHRNPLDIRPDVPLDQYRWSSYRYFVTAAAPPMWLSTSDLLDPVGGPSKYRAFVEADRDHGPLDWAVDTAILEADWDETPVSSLKRTIMVALLDRGDGPLADRAREVLAFPSDAARHMAVYRMRRHLDADPVLAAIADRALQLAA